MTSTYTVAVTTAWTTVVEASTIITGARFVNVANGGAGTVLLSEGTTIASGANVDLLLDPDMTITGRASSGTTATLTIEDQGTAATFSPAGRLFDVRAYGDFGTTETAATNTATIKAAVAAAYAAGGGNIWMPPSADGYPVGRSTVGSHLIGAIDLLPGVGLVCDGVRLILEENTAFITCSSILSSTATTTITADTTATTTNLTVSSSANFAAGDDVFIRIGTAAYDSVEPDHWLYATVSTIPDSTHITIDRPIGYAATVAGIASATNKSITRVDEWAEGVTITGVDLYNPQVAKAEYGIRILNARNIHVGTVTGQDPGAGLVCGQFSENVQVDLVDCRQSTKLLSQASLGHGIGLAECRNWHFDTVRLKDCENSFVWVESSCDGIRIDSLYCDNGFPGRSTSNVAIFGIDYYSNLSVGSFVLTGNTTYVGPDTAGQPGSAFTVSEAHLLTSGSGYSNLDLLTVRSMLTLGGATYTRPRTWTKLVPLTLNMSDSAVTGPSGYWQSVRVYASTTTGVTGLYLKSASAGSNLYASLSAGASVVLPNSGSSSQAHNAGTAKTFRLYTDGTVPAGAYLIFEVLYFEDTGNVVQSLPNQLASDAVTAGYLEWTEMAANPAANPTSGAAARAWMKGDKFIIAYNHGGTMKYRYLDLTSTDATWTYTTTAP